MKTKSERSSKSLICPNAYRLQQFFVDRPDWVQAAIDKGKRMNRAPWLHPLAARFGDPAKIRLSLMDAAKQARNRLRPFSAQSIVRHALTFLHRESAKQGWEGLQTWPWITLLIVKIVLEDQTIALDRGKVCDPEVFDECRQLIWDAQGGHDRKDSSPGAVHLMVRAMIQAQVQFQRPISWDFMRWPALIARLAADHPSKQLFVERFGMDAESFMCLCYASFVPVVNEIHVMPLRDFAVLRGKFGGHVDRFFGEFARDLPSLRAELRQLQALRASAGEPARDRRELNEFPWLSRYPLLRLPGDEFEVWHPTVFARGMEDAVHRRLSERKGWYSGQFSKVFESYVLELIDEARVPYLGEAAYKRALGANESAVEAIITSDGANLFVEAKLTAYSDDLATSNRAQLVWQSLKRVREAMQQGWLVGARLRGNVPDGWQCGQADEDFLIIVVSQPIASATGEHLQRLFHQDVFNPEVLARSNVKTPTAAHLDRLPLKNVLIASIDEFEHLMSAVRDGKLDLINFVREAVAANQDPKTAVMYLHQLLPPEAARVSPPALITKATELAEETILALLSDD